MNSQINYDTPGMNRMPLGILITEFKHSLSDNTVFCSDGSQHRKINVKELET